MDQIFCLRKKKKMTKINTLYYDCFIYEKTKASIWNIAKVFAFEIDWIRSNFFFLQSLNSIAIEQSDSDSKRIVEILASNNNLIDSIWIMVMMVMVMMMMIIENFGWSNFKSGLVHTSRHTHTHTHTHLIFNLEYFSIVCDDYNRDKDDEMIIAMITIMKEIRHSKNMRICPQLCFHRFDDCDDDDDNLFLRSVRSNLISFSMAQSKETYLSIQNGKNSAFLFRSIFYAAMLRFDFEVFDQMFAVWFFIW